MVVGWDVPRNIKENEINELIGLKQEASGYSQADAQSKWTLLIVWQVEVDANHDNHISQSVSQNQSDNGKQDKQDDMDMISIWFQSHLSLQGKSFIAALPTAISFRKLWWLLLWNIWSLIMNPKE